MKLLSCFPHNHTKGNSILVPVMACCRQATSHYLTHCWPRSMSPYRVIWSWSLTTVKPLTQPILDGFYHRLDPQEHTLVRFKWEFTGSLQSILKISSGKLGPFYLRLNALNKGFPLLLMMWFISLLRCHFLCILVISHYPDWAIF